MKRRNYIRVQLFEVLNHYREQTLWRHESHVTQEQRHKFSALTVRQRSAFEVMARTAQPHNALHR